MRRSALFIILFYGLAPGFTLLLLWLSVGRAVREAQRRDRILLVAAPVLALWAVATLFMWGLTFGRAWALADTRPVSEEMFPEGWTIYGFLAAYAVLGSTLAGALAKIARRPTSASGIENELPSTAFVGLRNVIVLSLPAIVCTVVFLAGVLVSRLGDDFNGAPPMSWVEPSGFARLMNAVLFAFYLALLLGAAFVGPVLLLLAGQKAFALTRAVGLRSTLAIWAWAFVVVGLVATAVFWGWLRHLDIYV